MAMLLIIVHILLALACKDICSHTSHYWTGHNYTPHTHTQTSSCPILWFCVGSDVNISLYWLYEFESWKYLNYNLFSLLFPRALLPFLRKKKLVSLCCCFILVFSVYLQILTLKTIALGCVSLDFSSLFCHMCLEKVCVCNRSGLCLVWCHVKRFPPYKVWLMSLSGVHNMGQERKGGGGWVEEDRLWFYETLDASEDKILDSSSIPSSQSPFKDKNQTGCHVSCSKLLNRIYLPYALISY